MPPRVVEVRAPARLHFGMFGFGPEVERQFGGVGVMIDAPGLRLRISAAAELTARGPEAPRALEFARRWAAQEAGGAAPACRIEILESPPAHAGLGSGTQLALSVCAGLDAWIGRARRGAASLAAVCGRGRRSAVGLHGFDLGGLIVDAGKRGAEEIAPLAGHYEVPDDWLLALCLPEGPTGLAGDDERRAFELLPPVPRAAYDALRREVTDAMLPALTAGDFEQFSESVYRFGYASGQCFAAVQGGPFQGAHVAEIVTRLRAAGIRGVGQSSWGPGVYAWLRAVDVERVKAALGPQLLAITTVAKSGAVICACGT